MLGGFLKAKDHFLFLLFSFFCFVACESYPKDPNNTLERAKEDKLKIGAIHAPPWVHVEGEKVTGVEADIAEGFAKKINTEIKWVIGSESELMLLLEAYELHMVIGGFTRESPWTQQVGITNPYTEEKIVVGAPGGILIPDDIEGQEVGVRKSYVIAAYVKRNKGEPVMLDSLTFREYSGLVAGYENSLKRLNFNIADWVLTTEEHVIAIPRGENHFLVTFERYLNEIGY